MVALSLDPQAGERASDTKWGTKFGAKSRVTRPVACACQCVGWAGWASSCGTSHGAHLAQRRRQLVFGQDGGEQH